MQSLNNDFPRTTKFLGFSIFILFIFVYCYGSYSFVSWLVQEPEYTKEYCEERIPQTNYPPSECLEILGEEQFCLLQKTHRLENVDALCIKYFK